MKDSIVGWVRSSARAVVKTTIPIHEASQSARARKPVGTKQVRGRAREGGRGRNIGLAGSFMAGPGIRFENLIERGMGHNLVVIHCAANTVGNLWKVNPAIDEGFNSNFVGGVEYGGKSAADFAGFARKL